MIIYQNDEPGDDPKYELSLREENISYFGCLERQIADTAWLASMTPNPIKCIGGRETLGANLRNTIDGTHLTQILATTPLHTLQQAEELAETWAERFFMRYEGKKNFQVVLANWETSFVWSYHNNPSQEKLAAFNALAKQQLNGVKNATLKDIIFSNLKAVANTNSHELVIFGKGETTYNIAIKFRTWWDQYFDLASSTVDQNTTHHRVINGLAHQYEKKLAKIGNFGNLKKNVSKL